MLEPLAERGVEIASPALSWFPTPTCGEAICGEQDRSLYLSDREPSSDRVPFASAACAYR